MTLTVGINAKEWKENDRGFLVELTAGYANATSYTPSERYANISPGIGYQFNKRWAAGFRMTFETRRYDFKIYTPFVRFNYLTGRDGLFLPRRRETSAPEMWMERNAGTMKPE